MADFAAIAAARQDNADHGAIDGDMRTGPMAAAPPLTPAVQAIDLDHLARMTFGERALEREVLALFDQQASMLLARMAAAPPKALAALAHTLNGSARGIGAWTVSKAAEAVECAAAVPDLAVPQAAVARLSCAVAQAHAAIAELLRSH